MAAWDHRTCRGGPWRRLLPGVYVTHSGQPSIDQKITGALLYAGPGAVLTGAIALWRNRVPGRYDLDTFDVLIPHERQRACTGYVRVQRTRRLPPQRGHDVACAPVARCVADAARRLDDFDEVRGLVASAVQQRKCTAEELVTELDEGPMRHSALLRAALSEVLTGVRSIAEAQGRKELRRGGIPEPCWNVDLYDRDGEWIGRPDGWWEEAGVALEIDSKEWHLNPADWERTMDRHAKMTQRGILVVHVTPRMIWQQPAEFVRRVAGALASGRQRAPIPISARRAA